MEPPKPHQPGTHLTSGKLVLSLFIVGVAGIGLLIGAIARPDEWYQQLVKPGFNPPGWIFAPVWTVLYILIAIVGWRVWTLSRNRFLKPLWVIQMGLNFLWSPIFFSLQSIGGALAVIVALLATILIFICYGWTRDRVSAAMFLPYLAWVAFATLLNLSIYRLNQGVSS